jgi:hypothetical protein
LIKAAYQRMHPTGTPRGAYRRPHAHCSWSCSIGSFPQPRGWVMRAAWGASEGGRGNDQDVPIRRVHQLQLQRQAGRARVGGAAPGRWPECHLGQGEARAGTDAGAVHVPSLLPLGVGDAGTPHAALPRSHQCPAPLHPAAYRGLHPARRHRPVRHHRLADALRRGLRQAPGRLPRG